MRKRQIAAVLLAASLLPTLGLSAPSKIQVKYDQTEINFPDQRPVIQNDRTLVPIRPIAETLGFEVGWDAGALKVGLQKQTNQVELVIGQKIAQRNGESLELEVPAQIINDRTMVPLRFIVEALEYEVDWQEQNRIVQITDALSAPI